MADKKLSELTAADALTGVEEAPFVQGGATKKATPEQIRAYVASQPNVFTVTQRIESAAPAFQFSENDTVDKNWEFIGVAGALRLDELNDAFSTTGTHHTFTHGGGTQFGSPTGGDQGAGTVNATGLYKDGVGVPTLDGGADANFTAMPQVGGDPIVESGSNSDGEWTRWADGTQWCGAFVGSASGMRTVNLPRHFLTGAYRITGVHSQSSTTNPIIIKIDTKTDTSVSLGVLVTGGSTYSPEWATANLEYMAMGRWK